MGYVDDTKIFLSLPPNQISDAVIALNENFWQLQDGVVQTP